MENFIIGIFVIIIALTIFSGGLPNHPVTSTSTPTFLSHQNTNQGTQNQQTPQTQFNQTTGIQTVGKEGNIAVSAYPSAASYNISVGSTKASFLGVKIGAQGSDIDVQRIRVNLGTGAGGANLFSQVFSTIYILEDGYRVLASMPLNSSTVNRESSGNTTTYSITLTGFHMPVYQNTSKILTVAFDTRSAVDSVYRVSYTISIDANGIRAIDGANINHTGPDSIISQTQTIIGGQYQNNL